MYQFTRLPIPSSSDNSGFPSQKCLGFRHICPVGISISRVFVNKFDYSLFYQPVSSIFLSNSLMVTVSCPPRLMISYPTGLSPAINPSAISSRYVKPRICVPSPVTCYSLALRHPLAEAEHHHIRAASRAINGKKSEDRRIQTKKVMVNMRHCFSPFFAGSIDLQRVAGISGLQG